jgi:hypothetical protein
MAICANLETYEGTVGASPFVCTFYGRPRKIIITNDSGSSNLSYKFKSSENGATLKPTETITLEDFLTNQVILEGNGVEYRVWGFR